MFHRHLHIFRTLTIILIVAAHSWSFTIFMYTDDWSLVPELKLLSAVTETLFHDGTLLFAFISGLLFSLVLKAKGWRRFYTNKAKYVLLPYLVVSFTYGYVQWQHFGVGLGEISPDSLSGYLISASKNSLLGLSAIHLWYMPVLFILFALTPLLDKIARSHNKIIITLLLFAPLVISRAWPFLSWTTIVYFSGVYLAGILVGQHYKASLALCEKYRNLLVAVFLLTSAVLVSLYLNEFEKIGFVLVKESVFYLQKLALIALLLAFCQRNETRIPQWTDKIGDYSFAIYFVHMGLIIAMVSYLKTLGLLSNNPWYVAAFGTGVLIFGVTASMALTKAVKAISGKYSRLIIGA